MIKYEYKLIRTNGTIEKDSELAKMLQDSWQIKSAIGTPNYIEYILAKPCIDLKSQKEFVSSLDILSKLANLFGGEDDKDKEEDIGGIKIRAVEDNEDD